MRDFEFWEFMTRSLRHPSESLRFLATLWSTVGLWPWLQHPRNLILCQFLEDNPNHNPSRLLQGNVSWSKNFHFHLNLQSIVPANLRFFKHSFLATTPLICKIFLQVLFPLISIAMEINSPFAFNIDTHSPSIFLCSCQSILAFVPCSKRTWIINDVRCILAWVDLQARPFMSLGEITLEHLWSRSWSLKDHGRDGENARWIYFSFIKIVV